MTNKLYLTENGIKREMTKEEKEQYQKDISEKALFEAEYKAKQEARENAIRKLAEVAGLSEAEINAIL